MKYSLMSVAMADYLWTSKPTFIDEDGARGMGLTKEGPLTFDDIRAFYAERGIPFKERTMQFEDFCRLAKEAGYEGVDMMWCFVEMSGAEAAEILSRYGLQMSSFNLIANFAAAATEEETAALFNEIIVPGIDKAVEAAACQVLIMPCSPFLPEGMTREQAYRNIVRGLKMTVAYAKEKGITVATETLQTIQVPYCSTGEISRVLEAVPGLGYVYDTANLLPSLDRPEDSMKYFADLAGVHMKDGAYTDRKGLYLAADGTYMEYVPYGTGVVDFKDLYRQLKERGFDGWVCFEGVSNEPDPMLAPKADLAYFRAVEASV